MQSPEHAAVQPLAAVFAALGDPTRLLLLETLDGGRERSISSLAEEARSAAGISASRQALTKHLVVLERAGLVACRKVGRETRFHARPQGVDQARGYLERIGRQWEDALGRLKGLVEQS